MRRYNSDAFDSPIRFDAVIDLRRPRRHQLIKTLRERRQNRLHKHVTSAVWYARLAEPGAAPDATVEEATHKPKMTLSEAMRMRALKA